MQNEILRLTKSQRQLDSLNNELRTELFNKHEEMAEL